MAIPRESFNSFGRIRNQFGNLAGKVSNSPLMAIPSIGGMGLGRLPGGNTLYDVADGLKGLRGGSRREVIGNLSSSAAKLGSNAVTGGLGGRLLVEGGVDTLSRSAKRSRRIARMGGGVKKQFFGATRGFGDGLRKNRGKLIDGIGLSTMGVPPAFATQTTSGILNNAVKNNKFLNRVKVPFGGTNSIADALTKQRRIPMKGFLRKVSGGMFSEKSLFLLDFAEF